MPNANVYLHILQFEVISTFVCVICINEKRPSRSLAIQFLAQIVTPMIRT